MKQNRSIPTPTVIPVLIYPDVREAVEWLTEAFGFEERLQIGEAHRSQMNVPGGGAVIAADIRGNRIPPDGRTTHSVLVRVEDANAHCEHSRTHGVEVVDPLTDHVYGERQYTAVDPWGHLWTFSETLEDVDPGSWGGELKISS